MNKWRLLIYAFGLGALQGAVLVSYQFQLKLLRAQVVATLQTTNHQFSRAEKEVFRLREQVHKQYLALQDKQIEEARTAKTILELSRDLRLYERSKKLFKTGGSTGQR